MWEHVRSCKGWVLNVTLIWRLFARLYIVPFLWDQVIYPWTRIVEFSPQTVGPISKWKKHFPPWKLRRKFIYSHSLSYINVSTEYLQASERGNGEMVAGHLQCWVEGLLDPEAAVILTGPLSVLELGPLSVLELGSWSQGWSLRSAAAWWVAVDLGTWTQSYVTVRRLHPSPQQCWEFLPSNPYLAD
jgi:hypothetical protein